VLAAARAAGVALAADGTALRLRAERTPAPELLDRLRTHKAEILELLRGDRCRHCGGRLDYANDWGTRAFGDGSGANGGCYYLLAAERAMPNRSPKPAAGVDCFREDGG
jgi:hypothetical protein